MKYYPITFKKNGFDFDDFNEFFKPMSMDTARAMRTDISEKDDSYIFEMEMPGYDKKDIGITFKNGYLTVKAEKCESDDEKDEKRNYIRKERKVGVCSRSFYIGEISEENITASYNNGILELCVPKEEKKPQEKQIEIK